MNSRRAIPIFILITVGVGIALGFVIIAIQSNFTVISSGNLVQMDATHYGSGEVQIIQYNNGSYAVRFVGVEISTGANLHVYLSNKSSFSGLNDSPGTFLDLGSLPYQTGTFFVPIPDGTNLSLYRSVLIYCTICTDVYTYATLN